MANYEGWARTNDFKVTDEEKLRQLYSHFGDEVKLEKDLDGRFRITGYDSLHEYFDDEGDAVEIIKDLQSILAEGEFIVFQEVGHQKFDFSAYAIIVTKNEVVDINLQNEIENRLKERGLPTEF